MAEGFPAEVILITEATEGKVGNTNGHVVRVVEGECDLLLVHVMRARVCQNAYFARDGLSAPLDGASS